MRECASQPQHARARRNASYALQWQDVMPQAGWVFAERYLRWSFGFVANRTTARNVRDAIRAFSDTQEKIVILRTIKSRPELANLSRKLPAQKDHVTQIVARQKEIRRPLRF